ncbi:Uncharacterised protein [Vibrio cholerae]|nr:Uncharacterised protein [Vibrio cholerae]
MRFNDKYVTKRGIIPLTIRITGADKESIFTRR